LKLIFSGSESEAVAGGLDYHPVPDEPKPGAARAGWVIVWPAGAFLSFSGLEQWDRGWVIANACVTGSRGDVAHAGRADCDLDGQRREHQSAANSGGQGQPDKTRTGFGDLIRSRSLLLCLPMPSTGRCTTCPRRPRAGTRSCRCGRCAPGSPTCTNATHAINASRSAALDERVEPLGCTWADVVFLSPAHPAPLFAALRRAGTGLRTREPWTLDARRLDPARAVIRLMRHGHDGHHADPPDEHDYLPFTTAGLRAVSQVTLAAVQRLEALQPGDPWLPWVDVPHVLYRGSIPVSWFRQPGQDTSTSQ
jgi:hypothetical protein